MKTTIMILIFFMLVTYLNAGQDSLYVEIKGDSVKIWNTDAFVNCCSSFRFDVSINSDTINVIENDTTMDLCNCLCMFDFCMSVTGLSPGTYFVNVYRTFLFGDSIYIGSISFIITNPGSPIISFTDYQSGCKGINDIQDKELKIPQDFKLEQNYPNPFNPLTIINYQLPIDNWVTIKVFNVLGQEVATLVDGFKVAGYKSVEWDANDLPSGIYYMRIQVDKISDVKKLVLIR